MKKSLLHIAIALFIVLLIASLINYMGARYLPENKLAPQEQFSDEIHKSLIATLANQKDKDSHNFGILTFLEPYVYGISDRSPENKALVHAASLFFERLPERKKREANKLRAYTHSYFSYWLSVNWSREDVLNFILQESYFGHGFTGLTEASQGYFGTEPSRLDEDARLMLMLLIKSPKKYDPWCNRKHVDKKIVEILSSEKKTDVHQLTYQKKLLPITAECD